jgi:hypothetical protein
MTRLGVGVLFLISTAASAGSLTEEFTTYTNRYSPNTTLLWNIGLGQLQPTMTIRDWKPVSFAQRSTALNFGDGRHGAFNQDTFRNFDSDGNHSDSIITINTVTYPVLQVTDFILPSGYTLAPTGGGPLIIRSLKDVQILGASSVIECSGAAGENTKNPENLTSSGGQGRCGGGNGGDGGRYSDLAGASPVVSARGSPQSGSTPLGGFGGATGTFGGGGGGTYTDLSLPGNGLDGAAAAVGGTRGTTVDDEVFDYLLGSAGGGGGGAFFVAPGNATNSTGGGGGGGGGAVIIYALRDFFNQGTIRANGGAGGGVGTAGQLGGLGGGGGAGTVIIIAGRNYQNDGTVNVSPGAGGSRAGNAGNGGVGGPGRGWYSDSDGVLTGTGSETVACVLAQCGTAVYDTGTLVAETVGIDLSNTKPSLTSVSFVQQTSGASTITVEAAGSKDNFATDTTGWVSASQVSSYSGKRYVMFRVSINNQSTSSPAYLDSITLNFSESNQDNFLFTSGCGRIESVNDSNFWLKGLLALMGIMAPYLIILLARSLERLYQLIPKKTFG